MSDVPVHRGSMFPGRTVGYKGRSAQELWQDMGEDRDGETSGHGGVHRAAECWHGGRHWWGKRLSRNLHLVIRRVIQVYITQTLPFVILHFASLSVLSVNKVDSPYLCASAQHRLFRRHESRHHRMDYVLNRFG